MYGDMVLDYAFDNKHPAVIDMLKAHIAPSLLFPRMKTPTLDGIRCTFHCSLGLRHSSQTPAIIDMLKAHIAQRDTKLEGSSK